MADTTRRTVLGGLIAATRCTRLVRRVRHRFREHRTRVPRHDGAGTRGDASGGGEVYAIVARRGKALFPLAVRPDIVAADLNQVSSEIVTIDSV